MKTFKWYMPHMPQLRDKKFLITSLASTAASTTNKLTRLSKY